MYKNILWLIFLSLIFLGILYYTVRTGWHLWQYHSLNSKAFTKDIHWKIVSLSDEEFIPFAHYQFKVGEKVFHGQSTLPEVYLNEWTAKEAISRLPKEIPVWFEASNPSHSSLQHFFPLKESLYTLLLWIIGIYFIALGKYVKKFQ